jgi:prepilin-type N-terminal cleavage/methylation domain-containing protein
MSKAFTLIELLVVTAIILFLTSLILPNYRAGDKGLALQRSASKLSQDLRRVQEMAMSAEEVSGSVPYGFGIYFNISSPSSYILFADEDNSHNRNAGDTDLETIDLESNIIISNLSPADSFSVLFSPPDPAVWINDSSSGAVGRITLSIIDDSNNKIIFANNAGLIYVE